MIKGRRLKEVEKIKDVAVAYYVKMLGIFSHIFEESKAARVMGLLQ